MIRFAPSTIIAALRQIARDRSGASAVEFAIIGSVLVVLSIGIMEFGRAFFLRNNVAYVGDVAVRSVFMLPAPSPTCAQITASTATKTAITNDAKAKFDSDATVLNLAYSCSGDYLVITLTYPLTLIVPFLSHNALTLTLVRRVRTPVT